MEWKGNAQVNTDFSYKLLIAILEDEEHTYDLIPLTAAPSPFVLNYRSDEEFAFSPLRNSDALISILYEDADVLNYTPEDFYDLTAKKFLVTFFLVDNDLETETLKWSGFLISDTFKYAWQIPTYIQLRAIDNLGSLKYIKYSRTDTFELFNDTELFTIDTNVIALLAFILSRTGLNLNINVGCNWKYDDLIDDGTYIPVAVQKYFENICYHAYAGVDFETYEPVYLHQILTGLMTALGCILYQSNDSGEWNIININEIGNGDGTVNVRKYDSTGAIITDTTIDFEASVNTGGDGLKWALTDQIVSINQGIGSVEFKKKALQLNMLNNYGFFKDEVMGEQPDWVKVGSFATSSDTDLGRPYGSRIMLIGENTDDFNTVFSNYIRNVPIFTDTCLAVSNYGKKMYVKFRFFYNFFNEEIGSPLTPDPSVLSYARLGITQDSLNVYISDPDGNWHLNGGTYYLPFYTGEAKSQDEHLVNPPVFNGWSNFLLTTFPLTISGIENIRAEFGKILYDTGTGNTGLNILLLDDVLVCFIPEDLNVKDFGYKASLSENDLLLTKKVDIPLFHGGTKDFNSSFTFSDVFYFERTIRSATDFVTKLAPHAQWLRSWEDATGPDEGDPRIGEDLTFKVARNYISFYRANGKRFEGTIYGTNIGFLRWFNYNLDAGKHTMITASFDYGTNFTKVVTHEDFSAQEETYYEDIKTVYTHGYNPSIDSPGIQNNNEGTNGEGAGIGGRALPGRVFTETYSSTESSITDSRLINAVLQTIVVNGIPTQGPFDESPYDFDPVTGTITISVVSGDMITYIFT